MAKSKEKEKVTVDKQIEKFLNKKLKSLKNELIEIQEDKLENLSLIGSELNQIEKNFSSISQINKKYLKELQKPLKKKLLETILSVYADLKSANLKNIISGRENISLEIDEFGKDEQFVNKVQPLIDYLYDKYWRVEVYGANNLNLKDNYILVANHGGILPWDSIMITEAVKRHHPAGIAPRFLIEDWFIQKPFVGIYLSRLGICRGSRENAARLIKKGEIIGIFPEGIKGSVKPFSERYHVQRFGRGGVIRTAIENRKKVIPVAVIGSDEIYPNLTNFVLSSNFINIPYLPITPFFPFFGPLGIIPLPVKWRIQFGEPIDYDKLPYNTINNELKINTLNEELRRKIQKMLTEMIKERRTVFLG